MTADLANRFAVFVVICLLAAVSVFSSAEKFSHTQKTFLTSFDVKDLSQKAVHFSRKTRAKRDTCSCHQRGTLYGLCQPLPAHGYKCICKRGYTGNFCKECSPRSYGFPICRFCGCHVFGSISSNCHTVTGRCECMQKIIGRTCDRCTSGYFRFPSCRNCSCPRKRTRPVICDKRTGACLCLDQYEGDKCERCKLGYFGYPECKACNCSAPGSNSTSCDAETGQCQCKTGFTDLHCDRCSNEKLHGPKCEAEERATKKEGEVKGGIKPTVAKFNGSNTARSGFCEGRLTCQPRDENQRSSCADLFYFDTESRKSSCILCGCYGTGTWGSILTCDKMNGQCHCKGHVQGATCDTCKKGFYDNTHDNIFGCKACQCNGGASLASACDDFGKCRCLRKIGGSKCDRLKNATVYLPDLFQFKFELEDSQSRDGSPAMYGYGRVIFPDFTWKGYVPFGFGQEEIMMKISIIESNNYKVLMKYILTSKEDETATISLRKISEKDSQKYESSAKLKYGFLRGSYAQSYALTSIHLTAGDWLIHIASKARGLYMDHLVLLPELLYNPRELLVAIPDPCHAGTRWYETCSIYRYIGMDDKDFDVIPGNSSFVMEGGGREPAMDYDDPDVLSVLKLDTMAMISFHQRTLSFDISAAESGRYNLILEYFNADETLYTVNVKFGRENFADGYVMLSKCPHLFLCRSAVISDKNVPTLVSLLKSRNLTVTLSSRVQGMIGIHRLIIVPPEVKKNDLLKPQFVCVSKGGRCIKSAKLPAMKKGLRLQRIHENSTEYEIHIPSSRLWYIVVHYKQPEHQFFQAELVFTATGRKRYLDVKYCPSLYGCLSSLPMHLEEGKLTLVVNRPKEREFFIQSITMQHDTTFDQSISNPTHLDMSEEYKANCIDENSLPMPNSVSQFCQDAYFTQIAVLNRGAHSCECHPRGSRSSECEKIGGQCKCHRNIIGRRCHSCRAGFFNFPHCKSCRCFMAGSLSPECSRNGHCNCRPHYGGSKCDRCKSSFFYGFPECKPCQCDPFGSPSQFCNSRTGKCQCLRNYRGRRCNMCQIGFYGYPECLECTCFAAGTKLSAINECNHSKKQKCMCKENVEGNYCNRCKQSFFGLRISNPKGCQPCKCDRAGTLNGLATCDEFWGQCHCKRNVDDRARRCNVCKNGYYGLDARNIFGCKACECNQGGSVSDVCEKKTGQCTCKPNITGRRCDRLASDALYVPSIHHLKYRARDGMTSDGMSVTTEGDSQLVALTKYQTHIQWNITLPKQSRYMLLLSYRLRNKASANIGLKISDSIYKSNSFETSTSLTPENGSNMGFFVPKNGGKSVLLNLFSRSYLLELSSNSSSLLVDYMSLIPSSYLTGQPLRLQVESPCSVFGNKEHCVRYAYVGIPRRDIHSIELEGTGRKEAEVLDQSKYPALNINGAVVIRRDQPHSVSFELPSSGTFVLLLQYFKPDNVNLELVFNIQTSSGRTLRRASIADCPHVFACRQVMLDKDGTITKLALEKGDICTISFSTENGGFVALDMVALIPSELWSLSLVRLSPFCVSWRGKCIKSHLAYPDDRWILMVSQSVGYVKPLFMPPNIRDGSLRPILVHRNKNIIRWQAPSLRRGFFHVLIHYFQPYVGTKIAKVIVNTEYSSIAGIVHFKYCPHVDGCRAPVLSDNFYSDLLQGIYVSGNRFQITFVRLARDYNLWLNYILLVPPTLDATRLLTDRPINFATAYRSDCIKGYDLAPELSKRCFNWLFQLVMAFNDKPSPCNCTLSGSRKASCSLIGGQCPCKRHVIGRTCSTCAIGRLAYPRCIAQNSVKRHLPFGI